MSVMFAVCLVPTNSPRTVNQQSANPRSICFLLNSLFSSPPLSSTHPFLHLYVSFSVIQRRQLSLNIGHSFKHILVNIYKLLSVVHSNRTENPFNVLL